MSEQVVREPGMQQERTTLAWRRTGLALLAGSLVVARLTVDALGPAVVLPAVAATAVAAWVVGDTVRQRRVATDDRGLLVLRDARPVAAVSLVLGLLAAGELAVAVGRLL